MINFCSNSHVKPAHLPSHSKCDFYLPSHLGQKFEVIVNSILYFISHSNPNNKFHQLTCKVHQNVHQNDSTILFTFKTSLMLCITLKSQLYCMWITKWESRVGLHSKTLKQTHTAKITQNWRVSPCGLMQLASTNQCCLLGSSKQRDWGVY